MGERERSSAEQVRYALFLALASTAVAVSAAVLAFLMTHPWIPILTATGSALTAAAQWTLFIRGRRQTSRKRD
ncbi:CHASE2 domain-containing sensor protein [Amycolatopsis bartoniae]|uniref:Uncharacterized protein n=1 Tax=Amycolatopsis bartoniae TaxID=941986 RepID=A0A8H9J4M8_9PSEU|nr:hypothetical protein [Amycolatopsis bartoniae]MBB2935083.1 CHASE2 domain-containing sensor protein [Amycolatopsis bartoniae]TVT02558.1 hypothetical protein FNH07_27155 [Amycolatopsis bartoniae]GHF74223.1 hypothetical protein GCM10017566_55010 [Amycolatopsis bartoniae]